MPSEGADSRVAGESPPGRDDERSRPGREYDARPAGEQGAGIRDPDLVIDVPSLGIDELDLEVDDLHLRVSIQADLADMVKLNVGINADLKGVKLEAKGIDARALVTARLDNVRAILSQALTTLDNNPGILKDLARVAEEAPAGARALEGAAGTMGDASPGSGEEGTTGNAEPGAEERADDAADATEAAKKKAEELGADLSNVEGSGADGRILVRDVISATRGG